MESFLKGIVRTAQDLYNEGWAEANAGNISVRLDQAQLQDRALFDENAPAIALSMPVRALAGEYFLVTAGGCLLRDVPLDPDGTCGVIRISGDGAHYKVVWGLRDAKPTSEFFAHLLSHEVRMRAGERVILHTHPITLIALCHARKLDTRTLTRLLWSMHPEGVALYPDGIAFVPFLVPGSAEISKATCEAFTQNGMVLWQYHGVFASGRTLDHAFGKVQSAEKAAKIYLAACQMGGAQQVLDDASIRAVAAHLGLNICQGILD